MSAFALMMALAACSNEEITTTQGGEEALLPGEAIIEIGLTNSNSRAARPVGSSAADNNVNHYKLVILKDNAVANGVTVSQVDGAAVSGNDPLQGATWNNTTTGEGASTTDRETGLKKIKLSGLTTGQYTIIAYAYNGNTDPYASTQTVGTSTFGTVNKLTGFGVEELFAGSVTATATEEGKFASQPKIIMERQVAGMLAYFKNVPAYVNNEKVEKIVVKANREAEGFTFPSTDPLNGKWSTSNPSSSVDLLTFTMTSAKNYASVGVGDTYTFGTDSEGKRYQLADGMAANSNLKCDDNTLFGGRFVLPYEDHVDNQTLTINFVGGESKVLKTLNVTTMQFTSPATKYAYDIRRNNFYSIGKKLFTDNTDGNGPDPTDPEPGDDDKDDPIDLSNSDEVIVVLNDAWDVLHDMDVE